MGGGISVADAAGTVSVRNSIVADNKRSGVDADVGGIGTINGANSNILGTTFGLGAGTIGTGNDIVLTTTGTSLTSILDLTLADNGGPTETHALIFGSTAIDGSGANAEAQDQRGNDASGTRDIGAFELVPQIISVTVDSEAIADGDSTPSTTDGTDFGNFGIDDGFTAETTFTITNEG